MFTVKEAAAEFLAKKRVAVTGVSRKPENHASNVVYRRLRQRGYDVFGVNPNTEKVEGDPCFHDLKSIPGGVDAVVIATRPELAESTMRECADLGIKHVWMHRSFGSGYFSLGFMRPGPTVWFGSSERALGAPGAGGSFAFADPDARLGYAYVMNKMDFYLQDDPREKALRDAVYRALARLTDRPDSRDDGAGSRRITAVSSAA